MDIDTTTVISVIVAICILKGLSLLFSLSVAIVIYFFKDKY